jgi:hypothetical protein
MTLFTILLAKSFSELPFGVLFSKIQPGKTPEFHLIQTDGQKVFVDADSLQFCSVWAFIDPDTKGTFTITTNTRDPITVTRTLDSPVVRCWKAQLGWIFTDVSQYHLTVTFTPANGTPFRIRFHVVLDPPDQNQIGDDQPEVKEEPSGFDPILVTGVVLICVGGVALIVSALILFAAWRKGKNSTSSGLIKDE